MGPVRHGIGKGIACFGLCKREIREMLALPGPCTGRRVRPSLRAEAKLIAAVLREVDRQGLTHATLAARSGLPRSAVTGILSGSLQKVTIDRVLRLVEAAGLEADIRVRRAA